MSDVLLQRIPVVAGLGYIERVRALPGSFTAGLVPEPENRYFPGAVAVTVGGDKVGYLAPEISRRYFEPLTTHTGDPITCPGRRAGTADHETSGVELILDFSGLPVAPAQ